MIDNRLSASELDELIRRNRIPRIPSGRGVQPQAAEAATEIGADDDSDPLACARGVVWGVIAALLLWFGIALAASVVATLF